MKDLSPLESLAAEIAEAQAKVDALTVQRDKVIVRARVDGFPWPKIADAARLSRQGAEQAARRGNKSVLPKPRHHD